MNRSNSPILVAEALASQLNGSLPIYLCAEDVNKHPDLSHLLEDLTHRLTPTGMHKPTYAQHTNATHAMKHARLKYLEEATLHRLIQDVVYQQPKTVQEKKLLKEVGEALTLAQIQSHLQLLPCESSENSPGGEMNKEDLESFQQQSQFLFGITPAIIVARAEMCISAKQIKVIFDGVEEQLMNEWIRIAAFQDPIGFLSYDPDEVIKIPEKLESTWCSVSTERKKLVHSITQTDYLYLQVRDHLLEYGNLLKTLMSKQRLCHYPAQHTECLYVQLSALLLKLKCIELEILLNTYTSKSVPALKFVYGHIKERTMKAERSLARLKHELGGFNGLDSRFKALLTDYAKIQADIEVYKMRDGNL